MGYIYCLEEVTQRYSVKISYLSKTYDNVLGKEDLTFTDGANTTNGVGGVEVLVRTLYILSYGPRTKPEKV